MPRKIKFLWRKAVSVLTRRKPSSSLNSPNEYSVSHVINVNSIAPNEENEITSGLPNMLQYKWLLSGSEDGVYRSEPLDYTTLSIVRYSKN
jgi:hypothetical protein